MTQDLIKILANYQDDPAKTLDELKEYIQQKQAEAFLRGMFGQECLTENQ